MVNNKTIIFLVAYTMLFILCSRCGNQFPLFESYRTNMRGIECHIKFDTTAHTFEYTYIAGLANDTIVGKYERIGKFVTLKPYKSTVEVTGTNSQNDISLEVFDGKTKKRMNKFVVEKLQSDTIVFTFAADVNTGDTVRVSYPGYDTSGKIVLENFSYQIELFRNFGESDSLVLKKRKSSIVDKEIVLLAQRPARRSGR